MPRSTWPGNSGSIWLVLVFLALAALSAAPGARTRQASAPASQSSLRDLLQQRLGSHPGVGVVVGLLGPRGERSIVVAGHAGEGMTRPLDAGTVFEIGSISKVFTTAILADMLLKREVKLDDPVAKYLPDTVTMPQRNAKPITLLALATHTSGLPRMPSNFAPKDPENPYADYSVGQLYAFLSGYELQRDVGERYEYSNLGMGLLGHALARRAGKTYEELLADRVTRPLGMKDTRITLDARLAERLARGHGASGDPVANWDLPTLAGAGAIRSTADDLLTFLAANLAAPAGPLGEALALTHLPREKTGRPATETGLAWVLRTVGTARVAWHNGGTGGYRTFIGFNPARATAVVVLHNSAVGLDDIGLHLLEESIPLDPNAKPVPPPRTAISLDAAVLDGLVGRYAFAPAAVLEVTREGQQLFVQLTGQGRIPAFAEASDRFFLRVADAQIAFVRDAAGRVTGLVLHQNGLDRHAFRQ